MVSQEVSRSFFDTNVLVYLFDDSVPEKKARAQEVFSEQAEAGRAVLHLHIHPEDGRVGVLDPQTKTPCGSSPRRFVLGQTAFQVARHPRFGSALTTEGADTVGGESAHADRSNLLDRARSRSIAETSP